MHEQLDRIMDMTLHGFARARYLVEFRAPACWPDTLWLVPGGPAKARLMEAGVGGHRVWSTRELRQILREYRDFPGYGGHDEMIRTTATPATTAPGERKSS